jgi:hypothetical protein
MMFSRQPRRRLGSCHNHPELRRDDIEALADVLANLHPGEGAARAGLLFRLDDFFDPLEMSRQRTPPGRLARRRVPLLEPGLDGGEPLLNFIKGEGVLTVVELLGAAPVSRALDGLREELQTFDLRLRVCARCLQRRNFASSEEFDRRMSEIIAFKAAGSSGRYWRSPSRPRRQAQNPRFVAPLSWPESLCRRVNPRSSAARGVRCGRASNPFDNSGELSG